MNPTHIYIHTQTHTHTFKHTRKWSKQQNHPNNITYSNRLSHFTLCNAAHKETHLKKKKKKKQQQQQQQPEREERKEAYKIGYRNCKFKTFVFSLFYCF